MPSLTLAEARERSAHLSEVSYAVELDLTDPDTFGTRTVVRFRSASPQTFLELSGAVEIEVRVNGATADATYDGSRIALSHLSTGPGDDGINEIEVDARVPYVTDGDGMHRTVDPADGQTYVGAYLGMDIARKVFACFDQVDLKATFDVAVTADPAWTVLANGRTVEQHDGRWRFATTPPIPTALLVVVAGPWASVSWEHAGLPFAWHARASLADELARDAEQLRAATVACFDHYAEIFAEPYPFDSYDQVFVPGLNWGAQEMPGCVTYRDELLPRGAVPEDLRLMRVSIIAHEMAHMWFGDLVTMTWWEDTWLQESFADYLGYRVAADGAGTPGALVGHEVARKPAAYDADERRSTHPVAPDPEDLPDADSALTIFDAISYSKGNSVLRQLATWLGDDAFLAGVNTYLSRHRFANATLADFVAALDAASDRDVQDWVERWLRTTGFDTLRVELDGEVPVLHREGSRPHRIRVTAYDDAWVETGTAFVDVADQPVPLPEFAGRRVVPNSHGETFARIVLDPATAGAVTSGLCRIDDELVRAVLWTMLADQVHTRALDPTAYVELVIQHLPGERSVTVTSAVLERTLDRVLPLRLPAASVPAALTELAGACGTGLLHATTPEQALAFATGVAATSSDADTLRSWLDAGAAGTLPLSPTLRWQVVRRLAELGVADAELIEGERGRDPGTDADLGAAAALAARPTAAAKAEAWATVSDPAVGNRLFRATLRGLWVAEQGELLAPYVERYLREATRWATRGQAFAQQVGHARPTLALSDAQVTLLDEVLAGEVPTVLRRMWEDWRDDLG